MLKRFEVKNYKGFKDNIVWDLRSTRDYSFNPNLVRNKIVAGATVFGKNGSGKSSFCTALVDITTHLLDVEKDHTPPHLYSYIGNDIKISEFKYVFQFDKDEVEYSYAKTNTRELVYETISVNSKPVLVHDFIDENSNFIKIPGAENLRTKGLQAQLSVIKYIYNNTIQDEDSVIYKIIEFVRGMLYFRSLREANQYIGYKLGGEKLDDIILRNNKLSQFNKFLGEMELNYKLVPVKLGSGVSAIGAKFENDKTVLFSDIASSGTKTLMLFFCWLLEFQNLTFLIIDEFDAYYHYAVSEKILQMIHEFSNMQSVVTTHNVTLLNTAQIRPDCAFILDKKGVVNLCNRTEKELREAHNIEKLYRAEKFNL